MSDKIQFIKETFDFSTLNLAQPNGLQGGSYFTKLSSNDAPLYIQTTRCNTKQGVVKTAKKTYCDLMFSADNTVVVEWFENLEKHLIDLIYEKRNLWFHTSLDREDIESQFTSPIRVYRSGKYYLVRVHVTHANVLNSGDFNCYNEDGLPVDPNTLNDQSLEVIPLIEIQGVKFSSRSFSCEISLKQLMLLKKEEERFNKCLITKPIKKSNDENSSVSSQQSNEKESIVAVAPVVEELTENKEDNNEVKIEEPTDTKIDVSLDNNKIELAELTSDNSSISNDSESVEVKEAAVTEKVDETAAISDEPKNVELKIDEVESVISDLEGDKNDLEEFEINLETLDDNSEDDNVVKLRQPNEVYTEIWREARKRAKAARKAAIEAYLEAKNIKATYMITEIDNDSEDEFDTMVENMELNNNEEKKSISAVSLG